MHRPSRLYTIDVTVHHGGLFALFPYRLAGIDGRIHLVGSVYKVFFFLFGRVLWDNHGSKPSSESLWYAFMCHVVAF